MTQVVLYIATSKDGFIADEHGGVSWLPQTVEETGGQDYGYREFYDSVDAIAIGRKTYEQILGFGSWPYPGKRSYIFSRKPMESSNPEVEFVHDDIPGHIQELESRNIKKLWLVGGAELIDAFYAQGRIDEVILTVFPTILKHGVPLNIVRDGWIKLDSIKFSGDVFQDHYIKARGL